MDNLIGKRLGRYEIIEKIGEGGMASVFKARDIQLELEVAIKVIRHDALLSVRKDVLLKRFNREAEMLAGLNHPNIVKKLDSGEEDNMPFLVMEYIAGASLKDLLTERRGIPLPWQEAAKILAPIARALDSAHKHKERIAHRDVKPSNILFQNNGTPMLTDFGIVKLLNENGASKLTESGESIGTLAYMAPEQWTGHTVDHRVDIYALGVVLFEMVTGQRPYNANTKLELMNKKANELPPSPIKLVPDLPEVIEFILFKSLANNPEDRYADMGELAGILERLANGFLPKIPIPFVQFFGRSNRYLQFIVGGVGLLFLLAIGGWVRGNYSPLRVPTPLVETKAPVAFPLFPTNTGVVIIPSETSISAVDITPPVTGDHAELIFVPAGEFLMGSNADELYFWGAEFPKHSVFLDAFWVYRTEVTNSMYRACVEMGECSAPQENGSHTHDDYFINPQFDGYPVIHVTYADAVSYCEWAGARLPSEAEWEKAARGTEGILFPWGNGELQNDLANFCDAGCPDQAADVIEQGFSDGYRDVAPVGSYPAGASPYGALDMAGNVMEWVSDWYSVDYYSHSPTVNPKGPDKGTKYIIRGGSWWSGRDGLRPAARASKDLDYSSDMVGFRCAVDPP